MNKIDQLREQGYQVKIRHTRRLRTPVFNPELNLPDSFLTKGEFLRFKPLPEGEYFGDHIESTGGFTEAVIVTPEGKEVRGKYSFPKDKPFNKRIGVVAALGRAQKQVQ